MIKQKKPSIFRVLLFPHLLLLLGEIALMLSVLIFSGILNQLSDNMEEIFHGQVESRHAYLLNEMVRDWSDLDQLTENVNLCVQGQLEKHGVSLDQLCTDSELYTDALSEASSLLISTMYNKQLSGAFLILAPADTPLSSYPGLYLRDRDPRALPSQLMEDILVQRAPRGVVQLGHLSTDTDWIPMFSPADSLEMDYFKPYFAAISDRAKLDAKKYSYWTSTPYTISGDNTTSISYSVPLILNDGTVYGVLGVELLTEYVASLLPAEELHSGGDGSYMLAVSHGSDPTLVPVLTSPSDIHWSAALNSKGGVDATSLSGTSYMAHGQRLTLYSRNAPFDSEKWYLVGCVPSSNIYGSADSIAALFLLAAAATLFVGTLGLLAVSYRLSRPIRKLSQQVARFRQEKQIPQLPQIHIEEIDQLVDAVTQSGQEVLDTSTRLLNILEMASVELAGYEVRDDSDSFFVSDNFFQLLGREDIDPRTLSRDEFLSLRDWLSKTLDHSLEPDGSILYTVSAPFGRTRYIRSEQTRMDHRLFGLIEDVTVSVLERKKAESERDYDTLSGLLNRHGFSREFKNLMRRGDQLQCCALLMLDLDKLKHVNDTFGHSAGDTYIITAGNCFRNFTTEKNLCARVAGDEFLIFYHGYNSKDEIREEVAQLFSHIRSATFFLPDGSNYGISASGGLSWYPDDSKELFDLMRCADFAMYATKRKGRGSFSEFDAAAYEDMLLQTQCQQEFFQLLERRQLQYHFQPIFCAATGKPFAYEALMRVNEAHLRSPVMVLDLAKKTGRMQDVETLTFFRAAEDFSDLLADGNVSADGLLFINSIADTSMTVEDEELFGRTFPSLMSRLVIEVTETEVLNLSLIQQKRAVSKFSGLLAIDDFGSGYNTELNLLELNPNFIKVDMAIIRDIHLEENKQHLVRNMVAYAHERGMKVIAEGLECAEEVETVLHLGVDLLQGYYLARPAAIPLPLSEVAAVQLHTLHSKDSRPL